MGKVVSLPIGKGGKVLLFSGFSLYQFWVYSFFFEASIYQNGSGGAELALFARPCSLFILSAFLIAVSRVALLRRCVLSSSVQTLGICFLVACVPLAWFSGCETPLGLFCLLATSVISALGTAFWGLFWVARLTFLDDRDLCMGFTTVAVEVAALYALVHAIPDLPLAILLLAPLLSLASGRAVPTPSAQKECPEGLAIMAEKPPKRMLAFAACWTAIGLGFGFMSSTTNRSLAASESFPWIVVFTGILSIALSVVLYARNRTLVLRGARKERAVEEGDAPEQSLPFSAWFLVAVFALIMLSAFLPHAVTGLSSDSLAMDVAALPCFSAVELCTLQLFIVFSRELKINVELVYALSAGGRSLGAATGNCVGAAFGSMSLAASTAFMAIPLVMVSQVVTGIALYLAFSLLGKPAQLSRGEERWASPISKRCETLAERYGLTKRETEVMVLLAKGRSLERVQEELTIAKGTATAHAHHIYRKLGIHSRQELMDMVDGRYRHE